MIVKCEYCQKEIDVFPSRLKNKTICCSKKCSLALRKQRRLQDENYLNCSCAICGKKFHLKKSGAENGSKHCCSKECAQELRRQRMAGENNHQYGLKGDKNSSWKSDIKISNYGYRMIRVPDHPFRNVDDFVFEHRLIAEQNLLTPYNSVEIDGKRYLSPDYAVHHIDENRCNNNPDNLLVLLKDEHVAMHNKERRTPRDTLGRFVSAQL